MTASLPMEICQQTNDNMTASSPRMELYQQTELRAFQVFHEIHMHAADIADENNAEKTRFNAVLRAATELIIDIDSDSVRNNMNMTIPPADDDAIQTLAVAHVCYHQILQEIGGSNRQNLPNFIIIQLLDLMTWIEFFQESVEEVFPGISKNVNFSDDTRRSRSNSFLYPNGDLNMENAINSLSWESNILRGVHRLIQDEFLLQTRQQADEWISKVYHTTHQTNQTKQGRLITSLCEDIFTLAGVQLRFIRERMSVKSDVFILAVCAIFSQLRDKHVSTRDGFLSDFDSCCAAANDFQRMGEKLEDLVKELIDNDSDDGDGDNRLPQESAAMLEVSCGALVSMYSRDAVFAAKKACVFIFQPIAGAIEGELFGYKWELDLTHNELAMILTRTLDDFMCDLNTFVDEFMVKKCMDELVTLTVAFYIRCLLLKAQKHRHSKNKKPYFKDNGVALARMARDIQVMRNYFDGLARGNPALNRVIDNDFCVLATIMELLLEIAAFGLANNDASPCTGFIVIIHKRIKVYKTTKLVVRDLWSLIQPKREKIVKKLIESLKEPLTSMYPNPEDTFPKLQDRMTAPGLKVDETIAKLYVGYIKKKPFRPSSLKNRFSSLKNRFGVGAKSRSKS